MAARAPPADAEDRRHLAGGRDHAAGGRGAAALGSAVGPAYPRGAVAVGANLGVDTAAAAAAAHGAGRAEHAIVATWEPVVVGELVVVWKPIVVGELVVVLVVSVAKNDVGREALGC